MNHRYPGPEEHQAPRLIVIGCVAGLEVETVPAYVSLQRVRQSTFAVIAVSPSHTLMHMAAFPKHYM